MIKTWPVRNRRGSVILFAFRIASTVVPNCNAIPPMVSFGRTTCWTVAGRAVSTAGTVAIGGNGVLVGFGVGLVVGLSMTMTANVGRGLALGEGVPVVSELQAAKKSNKHTDVARVRG